MKKLMVALLSLALSASVFALDFDSLQWEVYGGLGMEMGNASGYEDARLSDVRRYGAGEGSLLLKLDDVNGVTIPVTITAGGQTEIIDNLAVTAEVCAGIAGLSTYAVNFDIGAKYWFVNNGTIRLGAGAKAGVFYYAKDLGKAQTLPGTTPPVILEEGTVYNGDGISFTSIGVDVCPALDFDFRINEQMTIGLSAGYQFAISLKNQLETEKGVSIDPKTSRDYYKPTTEGFYPLQLDPKISLSGVKASVYVTYAL